MQAYKNEPTIASWNLINEPRCDKSDCAAAMQAWIAKMAPFLKQQDPNHLVTVGALLVLGSFSWAPLSSVCVWAAGRRVMIAIGPSIGSRE